MSSPLKTNSLPSFTKCKTLSVCHIARVASSSEHRIKVNKFVFCSAMIPFQIIRIVLQSIEREREREMSTKIENKNTILIWVILIWKCLKIQLATLGVLVQFHVVIWIIPPVKQFGICENSGIIEPYYQHWFSISYLFHLSCGRCVLLFSRFGSLLDNMSVCVCVLCPIKCGNFRLRLIFHLEPNCHPGTATV